MSIIWPCIMSMVAPPNSGKSFTIIDIIGTYNHLFDTILVFCNYDLVNFYRKYIPDKWIKPVYKESTLKKYVDYHQQKADQGKPLNSLLIFEDCAGLTKKFNTEWFKEFITTYRRRIISVIYSCHFVTNLLPLIREVSNYIFYFPSISMNAFTVFYKNYGELFNNLKDFKQFILKNTGIKGKQRIILLYYRDGEASIKGRFIKLSPKEKVFYLRY